MNTNPPTAEQFLAQHEPDEDDVQYIDEQWQGQLGPLVLLPADPMERVASALEQMTAVLAAHTQLGTLVTLNAAEKQRHSIKHEAAGVSMVPVTAHDALRDELNEIQQAFTEELADVEAKYATVLQVISDVEAALGKSKAAPALAAKAVIEAWRSPQVPETEEPEGEDPADEDPACKCGTPESEHDSVDPPHGFVPQGYDEEPEAEPSQVEPTVDLGLHTKVPHPDGFEFCQECSGAQQEWVTWPCPASRPVQPEHNAPVEEWRAYARALGYAGPEIDKANRSVIRTTLGIAQPVPEGGA